MIRTSTLRRLAVAWLVACTVVAGLGAATIAEPTAASDQSPASLSAQSNATLELTTAAASAGETGTVRLQTTATGVAGYQAKITFDPDVVQVESVSGVDYGDPVVNVDDEEGWVFMTQSEARTSDAPVFAEITLTVKPDASGGSDLTLVESDTLVNDGDGNEVPVALDNGRVGPNAESDLGANSAENADGQFFDGVPNFVVLIGGVGLGGTLLGGALVGMKFG